MRGDGVRYCWLIYHDGGYTSEEDSESGVAGSNLQTGVVPAQDQADYQ